MGLGGLHARLFLGRGSDELDGRELRRRNHSRNGDDDQVLDGDDDQVLDGDDDQVLDGDDDGGDELDGRRVDRVQLHTHRRDLRRGLRSMHVSVLLSFVHQWGVPGTMIGLINPWELRAELVRTVLDLVFAPVILVAVLVWVCS